MTAKRLYMLEWGPDLPEPPMYIVCEWLDADCRRAVMGQVPPASCLFTEEDLLASKQGREALDAWRRGDDSSVVKQEEDFEGEQKVEAELAAESERVMRLGERLLRGRM